jgi:hypothetical protein
LPITSENGYINNCLFICGSIVLGSKMFENFNESLVTKKILGKDYFLNEELLNLFLLKQILPSKQTEKNNIY